MTNDELILALGDYAFDPLGFVWFAFPWGEPGELAEAAGPEQWQIDLLTALRDGIIDLQGAIRLARTSGHGVGKSALVSWLILWAMSTRTDTIGVVTANTENQLRTKTWVQVAKWYRLFIGRQLFKLTATALLSVDPEHEKTWRFDMVPWSERNTEAFAGLHNQGRRILVIFDEASAIPDIIWEVTEGALTDRNTEIIWAVFGNPTRNTGRFRECFDTGRFAHRWNWDTIDSRSVSLTNKEQIQEWIDDYGEDHDFVRVRVLGRFPRIDGSSFIDLDLARGAVERDVKSNANVVIGVDVARFGDDASVIYPRCGRDGSSREIEIIQGVDTMGLAARAAAAFLRHSASVCMVDSGGVGGGVVDRLRQLGIPVIEVDFGSRAEGINVDDGASYANKRAEIWGAMRSWLKGGSIPSIECGVGLTLVDELTGPGFTHNQKEQILLESKKDMKRRGVPSPNVADALACTFAAPEYEFSSSQYDEPPPPAFTPIYNPYARSA